MTQENLKIAFRVDASIEIGTGHVMRCLTLAQALYTEGHECLFLCRDHEGHLAELIRSKGFICHLLSTESNMVQIRQNLDWNSHAAWLSVTWQHDAQQTCDVLNQYSVNWLVVDHYALDAKWELIAANYTNKIMVIDDLSDRLHQCDLLLDQTFGKNAESYESLVPEICRVICGSKYALLREEFSELRAYSLQRRQGGSLCQLLITMGGVDKDNITLQILDGLRESMLPTSCKIVVVMGSTAPWLKSVRDKAETLPWLTDVKVNVSNMAQLMADSDLAIGAAGATSWERSCLGLPSIMITIAENQRTIAQNMKAADAAVCLTECVDHRSLNDAFKNLDMGKLSHNSSLLCDGLGTKYVIEQMLME